jgi:hypothetical protein
MPAIQAHRQMPMPLFAGLLTDEKTQDNQLPPATSGEQSRPSINERQGIIERVFEEAAPEFIQMYRAFLLSYAERVEDFIANQVTSAFGEQFRPLTEKEGKQIGGLYQRLQTEGILENTGEYRKRDQGSPASVYRLKK